MLAEIDQLATLRSGTTIGIKSTDITMSRVSSPEPRSAGALALADGVSLKNSGTFEGALLLTLQLPPEPSPEAIPGVWHVNEFGDAILDPGIWNPSDNTITVTVTGFSDRFGGWWNPLNWAESAYDAGAETTEDAFYALTEWSIGKTRSPTCGDAPSWVQITGTGAGTVHSCVQTNYAEDGTERVELYIRSNRPYTQIVTVPSADVDYVWVQGQPDWLRPIASFAYGYGAGLDATEMIALAPGQSMSIGLRRPTVDIDTPIAVFRTGMGVTLDGVASVLGIVGFSDQYYALLVAEASCALGLTGLSPIDLSGGSGGWDSVFPLLECVASALAEPELGAKVAAELATATGMNADLSGKFMDQVGYGSPLSRAMGLDDPNALYKNVGKVLAATEASKLVINSVRAFFDEILPDESITLHLTGEPQPASIRDIDIMNSSIPPDSCQGWGAHPSIKLTEGTGELIAEDGSFGGSAILETQIVGYGDFNKDGVEDAIVTVDGIGSPISLCCAGRSSNDLAVLSLTSTEGKLVAFGSPFSAVTRGEEYEIYQLELVGTNLVSTQALTYPETANESEVGHPVDDPILVDHTWTGNSWSSEVRIEQAPSALATDLRGEVFGYVTNYDAQRRVLTIDVATLIEGDAWYEYVYAHPDDWDLLVCDNGTNDYDYYDGSQPRETCTANNNEYRIENVNPRLRDLIVSPTATLELIPLDAGTGATAPATLDEFANHVLYDDRMGNTYRIRVNDTGEVTWIYQQFFS